MTRKSESKNEKKFFNINQEKYKNILCKFSATMHNFSVKHLIK